MTQRIFDRENEQDMRDLWSILPDWIYKITKKTQDDLFDTMWCDNDSQKNYISLFTINWHDKAEITRPIQECTEQDIGKLCYFWGNDDKNDFAYGILGSIGTEKGEKYYNVDNIDEGLYFEHARRLTKQEIEELC